MPKPTGGEEAEGEVAGRPRLVTCRAERERGSRVRVRVELERDGKSFGSEREGVGEEVILLRLAAEATLEALNACIGRPGHFELVGAKRLQAFDMQVALVCVRRSDDPAQMLLGCVPDTEGLVGAASTAALHATNRLVERMGSREGATPDESSADGAPDREAAGAERGSSEAGDPAS